MEIADWLKPLLSTTCKYCGSPIVNNDNLTDRYCSNPQCPGHMAFKVSALATRMGVKGYGPATCLSLIEQFKFPFHICYLPLFVPDKPEVYLYEVGEMAYLKGFQKKWKDICEGKYAMAEVCDDPFTPWEVKENRLLLIACESYFNVKRPLLGERVNVMMTGSFDGYRARADFITAMNNKYGHRIQLVDVGKRKTGVDFLIKETWTSDHEKSAIARSCGIPIVTPSQMEEIIAKTAAYITEGGVHT